MVKMIGTGVKRHYPEGKVFDASRTTARAIERAGWGRRYEVAAVRVDPDTGGLRDEYEALTGSAPDKRWKDETLSRKVREARYQRRDMVAED